MSVVGAGLIWSTRIGIHSALGAGSGWRGDEMGTARKLARRIARKNMEKAGGKGLNKRRVVWLGGVLLKQPSSTFAAMWRDYAPGAWARPDKEQEAEE